MSTHPDTDPALPPKNHISGPTLPMGTAHTVNGPMPVNELQMPDIEKAATNDKHGGHVIDEDLKEESDDEAKQQGVKKVEAVTKVWSKNMLIATFAL